MLNEIKTALDTLGLPVFYGQAGTIDGEDPWDYVVFFRNTTAPTGNKTALADSFTVALVQEEYVPEDIISKAIKAVTGVPGVRLAAAGIEYGYSTKPNTTATIEVALINFVKPSKVER